MAFWWGSGYPLLEHKPITYALCHIRGAMAKQSFTNAYIRDLQSPSRAATIVRDMSRGLGVRILPSGTRAFRS